MKYKKSGTFQQIKSFMLLFLLFLSGCTLFDSNPIMNTKWSGRTDYEVPDQDEWFYDVTVEFLDNDKVKFTEAPYSVTQGWFSSTSRIYDYDYKKCVIYNHWGATELAYTATNGSLSFSSVYAISLPKIR